MEPYEQTNLRNLHSTFVREHSKLMQDIQKVDNDDKKLAKAIQKEIDLLYKCIIDMNKLMAFYREKEV
jgi:hypothetical protein